MPKSILIQVLSMSYLFTIGNLLAFCTQFFLIFFDIDRYNRNRSIITIGLIITKFIKWCYFSNFQFSWYDTCLKWIRLIISLKGTEISEILAFIKFVLIPSKLKLFLFLNNAVIDSISLGVVGMKNKLLV